MPETEALLRSIDTISCLLQIFFLNRAIDNQFSFYFHLRDNKSKEVRIYFLLSEQDVQHHHWDGKPTINIQQIIFFRKFLGPS